MSTMRILDFGFVCSVFQKTRILPCQTHTHTQERKNHNSDFILTTHGTMIKIATPKIVLLPNVDEVRNSHFSVWHTSAGGF
jgi:hypothetical protein